MAEMGKSVQDVEQVSTSTEKALIGSQNIISEITNIKAHVYDI